MSGISVKEKSERKLKRRNADIKKKPLSSFPKCRGSGEGLCCFYS